MAVDDGGGEAIIVREWWLRPMVVTKELVEAVSGNDGDFQGRRGLSGKREVMKNSTD